MFSSISDAEAKEVILSVKVEILTSSVNKKKCSTQLRRLCFVMNIRCHQVVIVS